MLCVEERAGFVLVIQLSSFFSFFSFPFLSSFEPPRIFVRNTICIVVCSERSSPLPPRMLPSNKKISMGVGWERKGWIISQSIALDVGSDVFLFLFRETVLQRSTHFMRRKVIPFRVDTLPAWCCSLVCAIASDRRVSSFYVPLVLFS